MRTRIQFLRFCSVGVLNTGIHYGIFLALYRYGVHYLIASTVGYCFGLVNSFIWNSRWTFKGLGREGISKMVRFGLMNLISLGVNVFVLRICVTWLGTIPEIGQVVALGFSIIANFTGNKYWTFQDKSIVSFESMNKALRKNYP